MQDTSFDTRTLPAVQTAAQPVTIGRATNKPIRIIIENVSAAIAFLSKSSDDAKNSIAVTSKAYRLLPGAERVYVLAPKQALYAAGAGTGVTVSISVSEAFPEKEL